MEGVVLDITQKRGQLDRFGAVEGVVTPACTRRADSNNAPPRFGLGRPPRALHIWFLPPNSKHAL